MQSATYQFVGCLKLRLKPHPTKRELCDDNMLMILFLKQSDMKKLKIVKCMWTCFLSFCHTLFERTTQIVNELNFLNLSKILVTCEKKNHFVKKRIQDWSYCSIYYYLFRTLHHFPSIASLYRYCCNLHTLLFAHPPVCECLLHWDSSLKFRIDAEPSHCEGFLRVLGEAFTKFRSMKYYSNFRDLL